MKTRRIIGIAVFVFLAALCGLLLYAARASDSERSKVRERYGKMRRALSSGDTNAAALLIAPPFRARARDYFDRLSVFARELNSKSKITVRGDRAEICPERIYPWIPVDPLHYGRPQHRNDKHPERVVFHRKDLRLVTAAASGLAPCPIWPSHQNFSE